MRKFSFCFILDGVLYCNSLHGRRIVALRLPNRKYSSSDSMNVISDSVIFGQMGIRAVNLNRIPIGSSPCNIENGGCSHICVKLLFFIFYFILLIYPIISVKIFVIF